MASNRARGARAEAEALRCLQRKGYRMLAQNARIAGVEVDLIMEERGVIVFIEVKARSSERFGLAREAVDARKQARLLRAAYAYMAGLPANTPARLDVIEVDLRDNSICHIENAFTG